MTTLIYGENTAQSRKKLVELTQKAKNSNFEIIKLNGKNLDIATLEEALGKSSLFDNKKCVIIEGLHSTPASKKKKLLISMIADFDLTNDSSDQIILWEKRKLTPTMIKKFPKAITFDFKPTETLFSWLDSLSPDKRTKKRQLVMLDNAVESNGDHMCFVMLIRQVRLLISLKTGGKVKGAPFMINKMRSQSKRFTLEQLLSLYSSFFDIDRRMKTSTNSLTLKQSLDLQLILL